MTDFLTSREALTALSVLRSINKDQARTQSALSTGKVVPTAREDAALWSISKGIESEIATYRAVSRSLGLGFATVAVAREAAESVVSLLTNLKGVVVEARGDPARATAAFDDSMAQIEQVVAAAQFNGLNLLRPGAVEDGQFRILSGFDEDRNPTFIKLQMFNLTSGSALREGAVALDPNLDDLNGGLSSGSTLFGSVQQETLTVADTITEGDLLAITIENATNDFAPLATNDPAQISYIVQEGDDGQAAAEGLADALNRHVALRGLASTALSASADGTSGGISIERGATPLSGGYDIVVSQYSASDVEAPGALSGLADVDLGAALEAGGGVAAEADQTVFGTIGGGIGGVTGGLPAGGNGGLPGGVGSGLGGTNAPPGGGTVGGSPQPGSGSTNSGDGSAATGTSDNGLIAILNTIDTAIENSIDVAAALGRAQRRIETQEGFLSALKVSLMDGLGVLTDSDLTEVSARKAALDVQQALARQSLSIINQKPQVLLQLFG